MIFLNYERQILNASCFQGAYILQTGGAIGNVYDENEGLYPVTGKLKRLIKQANVENSINPSMGIVPNGHSPPHAGGP